MYLKYNKIYLIILRLGKLNSKYNMLYMTMRVFIRY